MNTIETLKAARALITKPKHWTRKFFARHKNGSPIGATERNAVCFCPAGAVEHVLGDKTPLWYECVSILDYHVPSPYHCTFDFNDNRRTTHADVLSFFDRAIAAEEAKL